MGCGCTSHSDASCATDVATLDARGHAAGVAAENYTPAGHAATFALPEYVAALVNLGV